MTTDKIIETYTLQSTPCNDTDKWWDAITIKIDRNDIIQVLKELGHVDHIIKSEKQDEWFELNTWTDLCGMMDKVILK